MATTTPNFGWSVPTSSDLVKNGATAIETLGDSIDASLVDLKGGTTGQVLAKASNTDMDFTWAADASAATSLGYAAGKNVVLNGDFRIWQRGTSISLTNNTTAYTTDRWYVYTSFSAGSSSLSQQTFTPGAAPVAGYEGATFARFTAGSTATYFEFGQRIEDVRDYANQTATLSFWAKASANTTVSSTLLQNFGSGGSSQVSVTGASHSVTTSWTRFTATISVPSISGKTIGTSSYLALTLAANSLTGSQTIDVWGVQLEAGSTATAFQTATGTIQGELAACQRYYYRFTQAEGSGLTGQGIASSTTVARCLVQHPVVMRIAPASMDFSTLYATDFTNYDLTVTAATAAIQGKFTSRVDVTVASGLTQYRQTFFGPNTGGGYIGFSAELQEMTMDNVTSVTINHLDGTSVEHVIIDHGNGEFTSMTKAAYDELKANEAKAF